MGKWYRAGGGGMGGTEAGFHFGSGSGFGSSLLMDLEMKVGT